MGCYPLGKKLSKVVTKCYEGDNGSSSAYNMAYSPPATYQTRTMAKTVTFSNNNSVYIIPNEPVQSPNIAETHMTQPDPTQAPPTQSEVHKPKDKVPVKGRVRHVHAPEPPVGANQPEAMHRQHQMEPMHRPQQPDVSHELGQPHLGHGYAYGYGRYVPSPLPRWAATPKRHEYFSREYQCYPTPVREGIYSISTDANRLTSIFSEENPNACTIT